MSGGSPAALGVPLRSCIGCRRVAPETELVRVAATGGGGVAVGRHLPGRGAWLCAGSTKCLELAARRQAFKRALRADVSPAAIEALRNALSGRGSIDVENRPVTAGEGT